MPDFIERGQSVRVAPENYGTFFTRTKEPKDFYYDYLNPLRKFDRGLVRAHYFGFKTILELTERITNYNAEKGTVHRGNDTINNPDKLFITGIRIYNAISKRKDPDYSDYGEKRDIFFMPVLSNDDDLYLGDVTNELTAINPIILGASRPCPNLCGTKKIFGCD